MEDPLEAELFYRAILDSLSARIAVLDERGRIIAANEAWLRHAEVNDHAAEPAVVGADYFNACDAAAAAGAIGIPTLKNAILEVLNGNAERRELEYTVTTGSGVESFLTIITRLAGPVRSRVVVVHRDITELKAAQSALSERSELLAEAQRVANLGWFTHDVRRDAWIGSEVLDALFGIDEDYVRDLQGWLDAVHPDDRRSVRDNLVEEVLGRGHRFDQSFRVQRISDGAVRWMHGYGKLDIDEDGRVWRLIGMVQDITAQHRTEQVLRESERRYRDLIEHSPIAIFINRDDHVDFVNGACVNLFGAQSADELVGRPVFDLFMPERHDAIRQHMDRLRTQHTPLPLTEEQIVRVDGGRRFVEVSAAPFCEGGKTLLHVVLVDADQRKRDEQALAQHRERLSELAAELMRADEGEHHRLAVELHDGIGQTLAASKMLARAVRDEMHGDPAQDKMDRLVALIDRSLDHVRSLTMQLSPPALYELGLGPALEWLADDVLALYGLECTLELDHLQGVPPTTATVLFRAARELLSNVHRHARVNRARLAVKQHPDTVVLLVEDRGIGFSPGGYEAARSRRFGLFSIREDVRQAGGELLITSDAGAGTRVTITIPLERADERR